MSRAGRDSRAQGDTLEDANRRAEKIRTWYRVRRMAVEVVVERIPHTDPTEAATWRARIVDAISCIPPAWALKPPEQTHPAIRP